MLLNTITIKKAKVNGVVEMPPSKSYSQRAILAATLSENSTVLNIGQSNDEIAMTNCCKALGAKVEFISKNSAHITAELTHNNTLNVGESGLCARLMLPVAALFNNTIKIQAQGSLLKRPMDFMVKSLEQLGVDISLDFKKFLPAIIQGPYRNHYAQIDGTIGSQFLSGLLFALPLAKQQTTLIVDNLKSKPYIDITLQTLKSFGIKVENYNYKKFVIPANQMYKQTEYTIEGDWSSASTLLVAGAIAGKITARNLNPKSLQADRAIMDVLEMTGADITYNHTGDNTEITVEKQNLNAFKFDATDCPDLFPALVALAVNCNGVSEIKGVKRLFTKESNRALTLQSEFAKLGANIKLNDDIMLVHPKTTLSGGEVSSHNDHRIAMAMAVAALNAEDIVTITGTESVNKSYPEFFEDLNKITT